MLFSTGNKLLSIGGQLCEWHEPPAPPTPTYPTDMHFIYLANDYDGDQEHTDEPVYLRSLTC